VLAAAAVFAASAASLLRPAPAQIAVRNQGYVPFSDAPINYRSNDLHDPVANLQKQLDAGHATLAFDDRQGYLKSVLEELNIPVSSQTLVLSKTSFQYKKITPQTPRALYFNDYVYIGFVHDGKALEVVSFDPVQGAISYLLDTRKTEKPVFQRAELDCAQCHIAPATRNVPGVLLRSIFPSATGTQVMKTTSFVTGQVSPLRDRWGGWFVTGTSGRQQHLGNVIIFKHPCSYLIYSESFDALPEPAKQYVYHPVLQVLTEQDHSHVFARLTHRDRLNILAILLGTKNGLPAEWHQYGRRTARALSNASRQQAGTSAPTATSTQALNQTPKGILP
jgi:hypothetical protein